VADDRPIAVVGGQTDGVERLGQCADLIEFDENGIRIPAVDALLQALDVGHEEIVAHELHALAHALGEFFPRGPIVFCETVFDGGRWDTIGQLLVDRNELIGRDGFLVEGVLAGLRIEEFAGRAIERQEDVFAGV